MSFAASLKHGQIGESVIAKWVRSRGWFVLPVYEVEQGNHKGPRLYAPNDALIVPDMFIFRDGEARWIEAKHKSAFTPHRNTGDTYVTGIDMRLYEHYLRVEEETPWPVWLLFLQRGGQAKDSASDSPAGLYSNALTKLADKYHHKFEKGDYRMIYWDRTALPRLATLDELQAVGAMEEETSDRF